ncbi:MAG: cupin domain-containing protein [Candidatus Accumulibacter cognatus]|uniref:Cupin domain-containing protein n=1 Tax=Candidatus Accumulibacter cognatus TaxID=2954383 RepID=A0A7D5SIM5_9PROT|nr:MAG: cupin domain-containing protein [Candidatus Accumulibacter cognatus]
MKPIRNLDELTLTPHAAGTRYAAQFAQLGPLIGARKLGCRFNVIPPGKAAWPFHSHLVNEELVVVLSGRGTLRFGSERLPLRAGDVVGLPPGGAVPFLHRHRRHEETYVILSGRGEMQIDGEIIALHPGSVVCIKPDGERCWRNTSVEPMHYLVIQAEVDSLEKATIEDGFMSMQTVRWPA